MIEKLKNKFIVVEGLDGTGKSSFIKELSNYLNDIKIEHITTLEPGGDWSPVAPLLRSLCKDKRWNLSKFGNLFAFLLDRAEHVDKVIEPALKSGKTVLCDRFTPSTIAYQFYGRNLINELIELHGKEDVYATQRLILNYRKPDMIIYLSDQVGNRQDSDNDLFDKETKDFKDRVKHAYTFMAQQNDWLTVKAGTSVEGTLENFLELL